MDYTVHGILQARILEWVAFPFSRGSSQPGDRTQVSSIAGGFFARWPTREAQSIHVGSEVTHTQAPCRGGFCLRTRRRSGTACQAPTLEAEQLRMSWWAVKPQGRVLGRVSRAAVGTADPLAPSRVSWRREGDPRGDSSEERVDPRASFWCSLASPSGWGTDCAGVLCLHSWHFHACSLSLSQGPPAAVACGQCALYVKGFTFMTQNNKNWSHLKGRLSLLEKISFISVVSTIHVYYTNTEAVV